MAIEKTNHPSSEDWEIRVGKQCRVLRMQAGLDQQALAQRAGLSVGAVKNLENGKGSTLTSLIKVLRVLDRTDWLIQLSPTRSVSPMALLKAQKRDTPRQRVFRARPKKSTE